MRSLKSHWTPGKIWVFFWDEQARWVMLSDAGCFYFRTFEELQAQLNTSIEELACG